VSRFRQKATWGHDHSLSEVSLRIARVWFRAVIGSASHHPFGPAGCGCLRTRTSIQGTSIWSVEPTAAGPLNLDRVCVWQVEMQRAVRRRESLPAAACGAVARLLERFLEEEAADDGRGDEVRAAIALLIVASQRNARFGGGQKVDWQTRLGPLPDDWMPMTRQVARRHLPVA
jgi:hypothetical protein